VRAAGRGREHERAISEPEAQAQLLLRGRRDGEVGPRPVGHDVDLRRRDAEEALEVRRGRPRSGDDAPRAAGPQRDEQRHPRREHAGVRLREALVDQIVDRDDDARRRQERRRAAEAVYEIDVVTSERGREHALLGERPAHARGRRHGQLDEPDRRVPGTFPPLGRELAACERDEPRLRPLRRDARHERSCIHLHTACRPGGEIEQVEPDVRHPRGG
jgi:hypothetical protein